MDLMLALWRRPLVVLVGRANPARGKSHSTKTSA